MKQNYTSAATSINRDRLPAVYGRIQIEPGDHVLDYGCGRYTDHIRAALPEDVEYIPYDPYNQPQTVNHHATLRVNTLRIMAEPVTVICSNVLNVIDGDTEVRDICRNIAAIVRTTGGKAYITVYEGDRSGNGRQTGPDQYQRNQRLSEYLRFIPESVRAYTYRNMIVMEA